jgi:hypothetical protein
MPLETRPMTTVDRINVGPSFYDEPIEKKSAGDEFAAGFDRENSVTAWHQDIKNRVEAEDVEGYDQFRDIPDDLLHLPSDIWRGISSPAEMEGKVADVRTEMADREQRSVQGWAGTVGEIVGYAVSPESLAALAVALPTGGASVAGRFAMGAGVLAAAEVPHELAMHQSQTLRTMQESATNVVASSIMGGVIAGAFGRRLANSVSKGIHDDIQNAIENHGMLGDSTVSAAQVTGYNAKGDLIENPPWLPMDWLSPARPIAKSPSMVSKGVLAQFWENAFTFGKNADGTANAVALETKANQVIGVMTRESNLAVNKGYKHFIGAETRMDVATGLVRNRGQRYAFERELHYAMASGDKVPAGRNLNPNQIAAVEETAKSLRDNVYNKTLAMARESGLIADPEEFAVRFADSYVPRRWNKKVLRTAEGKEKFTRALTQKYEQDALNWNREAAQQVAREEAWRTAPEGLTAKEYEAIMEEAANRIPEGAIEPPSSMDINRRVESTYNKIVNSFDMDVFTGPKAAGLASPFKGREVPLDDVFLLDNNMLMSDMEMMTRNHINRMVKPSMMTMEAGDPEMIAQKQAIKDDYQDMIDAANDAGDFEKSAKLSEQLTNEIKMFDTILDRWYGRSGLPKTRAGAIVNDIFRGFRSFNTSLMMGMVLPTSAGDAARWNMATIYAPELGKAGPNMAAAFKSLNLNKEQWAKIGIAHETATRIRTMKLYDGNDVIQNTGAHAITDAWTEVTAFASGKLMQATHLAEWTDFGKNMAAAYAQNDMLEKLIRWDELLPKTKKKMARLGFDERMARAVQEEVERSRSLSPDKAGIRIREDGATEVNWDNWQGKDAETFGTILFRESERAIVTPSVIDMPLFLGDSELGKTLSQFMSFLMAAHNQIFVPMTRRFAEAESAAEYLQATMMMSKLVAGGLAAYQIREALYGRLGEERTGMDYALNAIDYSGAVPLLMMGFNGINMMTENRLTDAIGATSMSRTSHRPFSSVYTGPTGGTIENIAKTVKAGLGEGKMTEADWRRARRIVPWNNLMYFNAAERVKEMTE